MKIETADRERVMQTYIYPIDDNERVEIRVTRTRDMDDSSKWESKATISWSLIMPDDDVESYRALAAGILEACRIAEGMNAVADHEHAPASPAT